MVVFSICPQWICQKLKSIQICINLDMMQGNLKDCKGLSLVQYLRVSCRLASSAQGNKKG